jgi:ribonuclease HII
VRNAQDSNIWKFEKDAASKGHVLIAGVDEAGRGPLAGPVVSAAVILPDDFDHKEITDSKKLTPKKRDYLFDYIMDNALHVGVGIADHETIDSMNILRASLFSMLRAVQALNVTPDFLLIDGIF